MDDRSSGMWVIALTFITAMLFSVVSLPEFVPWELGYLRPEWVVLVLIYWVVALPQRIGLVIAWVIGLLVDVLSGSLLGQHGLVFIIIVYITASLYQRLRMFAVWQQSLIVFGIVSLSQLVDFWIENIVGLARWELWYLFPAIMSAFMWPWVFMVLRFLRRFFRVN